MQIIARLSNWYVTIEKIEWGLESPDSDYLVWCEHYHLKIPQIDARVFIEVSDYNYYVKLEKTDGNSEDDNFKRWEHIVDFIHEQIGEKHA